MRFIPACAGNIQDRKKLAVLQPVHPRVCGEHVLPIAPVPVPVRFIPACAGNMRNKYRT